MLLYRGDSQSEDDIDIFHSLTSYQPRKVEDKEEEDEGVATEDKATEDGLWKEVAIHSQIRCIPLMQKKTQ